MEGGAPGWLKINLEKYLLLFRAQKTKSWKELSTLCTAGREEVNRKDAGPSVLATKIIPVWV